MSDRYVLHDDGTWFYYLTEPRARYAPPGIEVLADDEPMHACELDGWWRATHEATAISVVRPQPDRTTGYRLADPDAVSARYPASLTVDEYTERRNASEAEGEVLYRMYERDTEPMPPTVEEISGPWLRLDGTPPAQDGRTWTAKLPAELSYRPEYLHLFPGYMPGFRDHMSELLKRQPHVQYVFDWKSGGQVYGLQVTLQIPFDQPVREQRPALNRNGTRSRSRKPRTVAVTATRRLDLPVPFRIDAPNRAAAVAEWNRLEADLLAVVADASVVACHACRGHGYVIDGSTNYERKTDV